MALMSVVNTRSIPRGSRIPTRTPMQKTDDFVDSLAEAMRRECAELRAAIAIGPSHDRVIAFADLDATPSVGVPEATIPWAFTATYSAPTTVTDFDDGREGQLITVIFLNGNVTLQHNPNIILRGGTNETPAANTTRSFVNRTDLWYEVTSGPVSASLTVTAASTFATDNAVLRADGTGRGAQGSLASVDDVGVLTVSDGAGGDLVLTPGASSTIVGTGGLQFEGTGTVVFLQFDSVSPLYFDKVVDDGAGAPDTFRFDRTSVYDTGNRHTSWELDSTTVAFLNQAVRFSKVNEKFGMYLDTNGNWHKVDGLPGGRFSFTDAGTTEPIT